MAAEGVDVSGYRSRRLTISMIRESDKILVMENFHKEAVLRLCPEAEGKVSLLTEYSPDPARMPRDIDVPDPIRMSDTFYKRVLEMIRECVKGFVQSLPAE